MPFFSRSNDTAPQPAPAPAPEPAEEHHHFSLFGGSKHRQQSTSPARSGVTDRTGSTRRTSASTRSNNSVPDRRASTASGSSKGGRSFLQKFNGDGIANTDPSIRTARERVQLAEKAERDADQALEAARARVREARAEVQHLEAEAEEEARRAKAKQFAAQEVSKMGSRLGRHDL